MLNQVILVGKIHKMDQLTGIVTINVERKDNGNSDLIPVTLSEGLAESTFEYLKVNTTIGVKAFLNIDNEILRIIGEKITFINTK